MPVYGAGRPLNAVNTSRKKPKQSRWILEIEIMIRLRSSGISLWSR
jgi:hypothetical protein